MAKRKQKVEIKIVENGKPEILFLPLSIGTKILRKIAAIQEDEKLTDNDSTKVKTEDENQKLR